MLILVICSRNQVCGPGSKIPYPPVPNPGNYYTVFHRDCTTYHQFCICILHLFTMLNSIVALMYFRLHIYELNRSITRRTLVSETSNIISCDAPTPQAVVFVTDFRYPGVRDNRSTINTKTGYDVTYLGQMEFGS